MRYPFTFSINILELCATEVVHIQTYIYMASVLPSFVPPSVSRWMRSGLVECRTWICAESNFFLGKCGNSLTTFHCHFGWSLHIIPNIRTNVRYTLVEKVRDRKVRTEITINRICPCFSNLFIYFLNTYTGTFLLSTIFSFVNSVQTLTQLTVDATTTNL